MNELVKVTQNQEFQNVVSARDLHKELEIKTRFSLWVEQNFKNFDANEDFSRVVTTTPLNQYGGTQEITDYAITLDMAKHLAMLSKTEKGKEVRRYFIEFEKMHTQTPTTYKDALLALVAKIEENEKLQLENKVQSQQIGELKPKASYYDLVLQSDELLPISIISKDYGMSPRKMNTILASLGVQYKTGGVWLLYAKYQDKGYTQTKTHVIDATKTKVHMYWKQSGRLFLYNLLKNEGILPNIEK